MPDLSFQKTASTHSHLGRWLLISIVGLIVGWYVVLGVAVYGGWWQGPKTIMILRVTPLPVASVGWRLLSYADWLDQRRAVVHYSAYQATAAAGGHVTTLAEAGAVALTKMVRLAETEQLLGRLRITVSAADVNQAFQAQLLQNGSTAEVQSQITALYGWTPESFKHYVIRPAVIRQKLQEKLSFDQTLSVAAKAQADRVLALVKAPDASFTDLAKQYSQDVYVVNGGDVGFVTQGEQAKEINDAAFSLPVNQISDLVHTQFGYHILKPIARQTVDGSEQVHLLQITILAPPVDQYVSDHFRQTRVVLLTPGFHWQTSTATVTHQ